ncbi:hypothetical protein CI610_03043 [invertebrate metagenome]|uniref:Uncharacterized protein n=1 Tax=invertebrate metagenome TaxID=1711999 RepID=A0A2H9T4A4_9ZZZZ
MDTSDLFWSPAGSGGYLNGIALIKRLPAGTDITGLTTGLRSQLGSNSNLHIALYDIHYIIIYVIPLTKWMKTLINDCLLELI